MKFNENEEIADKIYLAHGETCQRQQDANVPDLWQYVGEKC